MRAVSLAAFLAPAVPILLDEDAVTLAFPAAMSFHRGQCEDEGRRRTLEGVIASVFGRALRVRFETAEAAPEPVAEGGKPAAERNESGFDRVRHEEIESLRDAPAVQAIEKVFRVRMVRAGRRAPGEATAPETAGGPGTESAQGGGEP